MTEGLKINDEFGSFRMQLVPIFFLIGIVFLNVLSRVIFSPLLLTIEADFHLTHAQASSFFMLISAGLLLLLGTLAVFTASSFKSLMLTDSDSGTIFLFPHIRKVFVGLLAGLIAWLIPPDKLKKLSPVLYAGSIALLLALLLLRGSHWAPFINGSARWFVFWGFLVTGAGLLAIFAWLNMGSKAPIGVTVSPYKGLAYAKEIPGSESIFGAWNAIYGKHLF